MQRPIVLPQHIYRYSPRPRVTDPKKAYLLAQALVNHKNTFETRRNPRYQADRNVRMTYLYMTEANMSFTRLGEKFNISSTTARAIVQRMISRLLIGRYGEKLAEALERRD